MIIRGKEKWKEVIEAQKQSGLTIKKYCNDNHICISSFYKQKALILEEENTFIPVIIDKSNDVIDFDIDHHHISCTKQNLKILLDNLLWLSIPMKSKIFMLPSSFVTWENKLMVLLWLLHLSSAWMSWIIACLFLLIFHQATFGFVGS